MASAKPLSAYIDGERLWARHLALAAFGARPDGGVDRPTLSAEEAKTRAQIIAWGRMIGLKPFTDRAANLFLRLEGQDPSLPPVVAGSHIDSQPTGGRFDGVFGVLAALETAQAIMARGERPLRPVEIVAWTNEEGSRFAPGMTGSDLFTGTKELAQVLAIRDADGVSVEQAVAAILAGEEDVPLRPFRLPIHAYVEPHIEQASVLERAGIPIGVVTGIQGTRRYRIRVRGEAAHAGTALRKDRRDALMTAARMICAMDEAAREPADTLLTVGMLQVTPNAPSVVPAEAFFSVDLRHPDNAVVDRVDGEVRRIVEEMKGPCAVELREIQHSPSLDFAPDIRSTITKAAATLGIPAMEVYSAAGHDARQLHYVCPAGMIFVPCRGGISHNPDEWAEPEHLTAGARVLADTVWVLANQKGGSPV
ncbi:MAG TPA: M20 family metallo-hydrolase [Bosea sp. (in: a-proteobacteria)]|jgi:N-carbamoyl-L-amino-acid hydrolase|uniref:M20 family metallo-hydrolase n=1 Tax=Bosea sp. (in: a-proteobacteria) TaxID=1871050 RepID=UPI002E0FD995|nr:M20 family metallo-hydrolase [Bosea sp. (in: a-proteobacteria)]